MGFSQCMDLFYFFKCKFNSNLPLNFLLHWVTKTNICVVIFKCNLQFLFWSWLLSDKMKECIWKLYEGFCIYVCLYFSGPNYYRFNPRRLEVYKRYPLPIKKNFLICEKSRYASSIVDTGESSSSSVSIHFTFSWMTFLFLYISYLF